jgi:serine/threonine protein kinase
MDSESLLQAIGRWRALDAGRVEEVRRTLLPRFRYDSRGLAAELLKRNWLTPFQINRLFVGRGSELLVGGHVLLERLGEGGMGQVFKARNWKLDRFVALKLIRKELLTNPTAVGRFYREIEATAQLDHPNLIRALDAGRTDEGLYIVMEFVDGVDLGRLVRASGPLPPERACAYVRQAALGLQHAFERGLVHRDIKPQNLLLTAAGEVIKVLDLGLARLADREPVDGATRLDLTQMGVIVGTVDFMAPEQARDPRGVDVRADLYSLGCTFCYLLTGKPPFPGGTPTEKILKHYMDPSPPLLAVPPRVRGVIHKLLAKNPEDRYQTPAELAAALAQLLDSPGQLWCSTAALEKTVPTVHLPGSGSTQEVFPNVRAGQQEAVPTATVKEPAAMPEREDSGEGIAPATAPRREPMNESQKRVLLAGFGVFFAMLVYCPWTEEKYRTLEYQGNIRVVCGNALLKLESKGTVYDWSWARPIDSIQLITYRDIHRLRLQIVLWALGVAIAFLTVGQLRQPRSPLARRSAAAERVISPA